MARVFDISPLKINGQTVPMAVRVDARAKRLILRMDNHGKLTVTCPGDRYVDAAIQMARSRTGWIADRLAELPEPAHLRPGVAVPVLGKERMITFSPSIQTGVVTPDSVSVPAAVDNVGDVVVSTLAKELKRYCRNCADHWQDSLGVQYSRVRVRDMKTRWGSCTARGDLTFNTRLVFAPPQVLDYVILHEMCHLRFLDHSPEFWSLVENHCQDYLVQEAWLKSEGRSLFRYGTVGDVSLPPKRTSVTEIPQPG